MNWKILGNAVLVTTILTVISFVLFSLCLRFPWLIGVVVFILVVALIYIDMCKYDELDDAKEDEELHTENLRNKIINLINSPHNKSNCKKI